MLELDLRPVMQPHLTARPSPALIEAAELLAMPLAAIAQLVDGELRSNPALDRRPAAGCPVCASPRVAHRCPYCGRRAEGAWRGDRASPGGVEHVATRRSSADRLLDDVMLILDASERELAAQVIACLDGRGFLREGVTGTAAALDVPATAVTRVVDALRAVGPVGVAARGPRDCMLRQLDRADGQTPTVELAKAIVRDHLTLLAAGRHEALARTLGVRRDDVIAARDLLVREVRPFPQLHDDDRPRPARRVPDVAVLAAAQTPEELRIVVLERHQLGLRIHPGYRQLAVIDAVARRQVAAAEGLMTRLARRWDTMERITRRVVEVQRSFIADRYADLRPLSRAEVATAIGRHESTVGRATAGRSLLTPDGRVVEFAALFRPNDAALATLRSLIASEDRPLSDGQLAKRMGALGHPVARRTVAKYRARLGIPPIRER